jgi:hypothetical protein
LCENDHQVTFFRLNEWTGFFVSNEKFWEIVTDISPTNFALPFL